MPKAQARPTNLSVKPAKPIIVDEAGNATVSGVGKGHQVVDRDAAIKAQIEAQQKMLQKITTAVKFISFKGGNIIIDGKAVPGAKADVVPLAFMGERSWYEEEFDPDSRQSPQCYAYMDPAHMEDEGYEAVPHPEAKNKQCETCADCKWNKWASASKGRGKACREAIRLALVANAPDLSKQPTWFARIPITSVAAFKTYISELLGYGKPIYAAVAELSVIPDAKSFFKILWAPKKALDDKNYEIAYSKAQAAEQAITFAYPDFDEEQPKQQPAKQLKGKRK